MPVLFVVCFRRANPSVRARSDSDDALRGFPFKGVGDSREKVRFKLVKGHQQNAHLYGM